MFKCRDKFCSWPEIKSNEDADKCSSKAVYRSGANRACWYHRDGGGCLECGGNVIHSSGCKMCVSCGWSACG